MAIYKWICTSCKKKSKRILNARPELPPCECGGTQTFDIEGYEGSVLAKETIDNGLMARRVTRLTDIQDLVEKNRQKPKKPELI